VKQTFVLASFVALRLSVCAAPGLAQTNPFTVADSIQMSHFNDPTRNTANPPDWKISPDGSEVLLVTTRGIISSDEVETTLWIIDLRDVAQYLKRTDDRTPPSPKQIYAVHGQLRTPQGDSYGSLITDCHWSLDSHAIYALLEEKDGRRELNRVDVITGQSERLSPRDYNVEKYEVDTHGVFYSAAPDQKKQDNKDSSFPEVVESTRGKPLNDLLWPNSSWFPKKTLFRSDSNGVRAISQAPAYCAGQCSSIAPDGDTVIALVPIEDAPLVWKAYLPAFPEASLFRSGSSQPPITEYEVINLRTNTRRALLSSPSGIEAGYADRPQVVWSSTSNQALITNTFLPRQQHTQEEQEARRRPCAVAYINLENGKDACIVFERSAKEHESTDSWAVSDIRFGSTEQNVIVNLSWRGRHKIECYSWRNGTWSLDHNSLCETIAKVSKQSDRAQVRLELVQGLDEPPSLWAEDTTNSRRAQVWNPNPQITGKESGTTSEYHWRDKDNREWVGGLILPHGYKPGSRYPLVIQTHGFRPNEFLVDGVWTTAMAARPLAAEGFVVLQVPDNREQMQTLEEAKIHVNGYMAAIDQLTSSGIIDPKRVGIIGFSRTCWYVEESLLEFPNRFSVAVLADGYDASYFQYMLERPELSTFEPERFYGGMPIGGALETWIGGAPGFRLSRFKTPLRLQAISPFNLLLEWETYASLKIQDKPVDMLYLPLGQHVLQNPAELMASEQGDVDWFRFWLQGYERPSAEDPDQYKRWEHLRDLQNVKDKSDGQLNTARPH
jgi:dipeptidyl aminopeptidase/acylaminoacyl peptidase